MATTASFRNFCPIVRDPEPASSSQPSLSREKIEQPPKPQVVVLNRVSSVGKTSVARAIQRLARKLFLNVQIDNFLAMLTKLAIENKDGLVFGHIDYEIIDVKSGYAVECALSGMPNATACMAKCGNHIVADDVSFGDEDFDYRLLLRRNDFYLVGLFAFLEALQRRERERGDREIGLAKSQY